MAASRTALPSVVPATVVSAARVPSRAPVAMTSVTIGPGVMTRTAVITRKAANSSQFMTILPHARSASSSATVEDPVITPEN